MVVDSSMSSEFGEALAAAEELGREAEVTCES